MPSDASFDIVSEVNLQAVDDAVNTANKEISTRFDLKSTGAKVELNRVEKTVTIFADSDFQLKQLKALFGEKMARRELSAKALSVKKTETVLSGAIREINSIVCGLEKELAKSIVKDIKGLKLKVQPSINDDKIRVSAKSKDDLQAVIKFVRAKDYPVPLQFTNYR